MIFIFLDPSPHTYPTCSWVSQRPLGDPSYTLSFPTADSLKEDKYGLEKGYSHFWPNLENVDLKTKVPQLRVSPTLGRTASSPTLGSPTPPPLPCSSQPLLTPFFFCLLFPSSTFRGPRWWNQQPSEDRRHLLLHPPSKFNKRGTESPLPVWLR